MAGDAPLCLHIGTRRPALVSGTPCPAAARAARARERAREREREGDREREIERERERENKIRREKSGMITARHKKTYHKTQLCYSKALDSCMKARADLIAQAS